MYACICVVVAVCGLAARMEADTGRGRCAPRGTCLPKLASAVPCVRCALCLTDIRVVVWCM